MSLAHVLFHFLLSISSSEMKETYCLDSFHSLGQYHNYDAMQVLDDALGSCLSVILDSLSISVSFVALGPIERAGAS
jgi:hypothetical protein